MSRRRLLWAAAALAPVALAVAVVLRLPGECRPGAAADPWRSVARHRPHLDHAAFFPRPLQTPQQATRACLACHPDAAREVMNTVHWTWESEPVAIPGRAQPLAIGKKNLLNNFCLGIRGNWAECVSCHAGYGWADAGFDFSRAENVDCLVCHERSGGYGKGELGLPLPGTDLNEAARSVGFPTRRNCAVCHVYGGGGMGVKHGDLDETLLNPTEEVDVHMGRHNFLCVDCHRSRRHLVAGTAYSVSVDPRHGIACTDCHCESGHSDERLNRHTRSLACTTCHVPEFARKAPTKMAWDWSKAGDGSRADDIHHYLKIKGEFVYRQAVVPEYAWFNRRVGRYILGDPIDPGRETALNPPQGGVADPESRIWPFKVHRTKQPYDLRHRYLLQPVLSGRDGFWHLFDWDIAFSRSEAFTGLPYSGEFGFADTAMHWPISHMTAPKERALQCADCHDGNRFDWQALGYRGDPARVGGRFAGGAR